MLKTLYRLWLFIGSVYAALLLIAITAAYVAVGTLLEANSGSHRLAAHYTFSSPYFASLLIGFFINIAAAALQRWPWRRSQLPFLLAHLGLLLLLSGAIIKIYWGIQGTLSLAEGSGADEYFIADSYSIKIDRHVAEKNGLGVKSGYFAFDPGQWQKRPLELKCQQDGFDDVSVKVIDYQPHSIEKLTSWVKDGKLALHGLAPISFKEKEELFDSEPTYAALQGPYGPLWHVYAVKGEELPSVTRELLASKGEIELVNQSTGKATRIPLQRLLGEKVSLDDKTIQAKLRVEEPALDKPSRACLELIWHSHDGSFIDSTSCELSLDNPPMTLAQAIEPDNYTWQIHCLPTLIFSIKRDSEEVSILAFDDEGLLYGSTLPKEHTASLYSYSDGFDGYRARHPFPFPIFPHTLRDRQQARLYQLYLKLAHEKPEAETLAWPLKLLSEASSCKKRDFSSIMMSFFASWHASGNALCKLPDTSAAVAAVLSAIVFDVPSASSLEQLDPALLLSIALTHLQITPNQLLSVPSDNWQEELRQWHAASLFKSTLVELYPLTSHLSAGECAEFLQQVSFDDQRLQGIHSAYELWRKHTPSLPIDPCQGTALYLPPFDVELTATGKLILEASLAIPDEQLALEANLQPVHIAEKSLEKWEDNLPLITCEIGDSRHSDIYTLAFQRNGQGLMWPILDGRYKIRFQPIFKPLPCRLRLRHAHQINYPHSEQPLSYECELWVTPKNAKKSSLAALSMNHVWESPEGYRFYLANIFPGTPGQLQRIQLAVNRDPAKYWLTYPGAIILAFGILLLLYRLRQR